jgi:hypothetical protein
MLLSTQLWHSALSAQPSSTHPRHVLTPPPHSSSPRHSSSSSQVDRRILRLDQVLRAEGGAGHQAGEGQGLRREEGPGGGGIRPARVR